MLNDVVEQAAIPLLSDVIDSVASQVKPVLQEAMRIPVPNPRPEPLARIELELQEMAREIVDEVIADYLPRIEQELRGRLEEKLSGLLRIGRR